MTRPVISTEASNASGAEKSCFRFLGKLGMTGWSVGVTRPVISTEAKPSGEIPLYAVFLRRSKHAAKARHVTHPPIDAAPVMLEPQPLSSSGSYAGPGVGTVPVFKIVSVLVSVCGCPFTVTVAV